MDGRPQPTTVFRRRRLIMSLPEVGQTVPDFSLPHVNGGNIHHLSEIIPHNPTLIAFFKKSCATSRMTLPFVERLQQHYPALQLLGVSQDDVADTQALIEQTGIRFPILMDSDWKVSTEYDLFTVPSVFLLDKTGKVVRVNLGWNKEHYEALSHAVAQLLNVEPVTLVTDTDKVPAFRPG